MKSDLIARVPWNKQAHADACATAIVTSTSESAPRLAIELTDTAFATGIILVAGMVTGLLAARMLGPGGRGELTASTIWPSTILYAGTFGVTEATAYFTASRRQIADDIFLTSQTIALALGVLITAVGWIILPIALAQHAPVVQQYARTYLLFFAVPCLGSLSACAWLQGAGHVRAFNVIRATVHVSTALTMTALTVLDLASVRNYMGAMLLGNLSGWLMAVGAWFVQRNGPGRVMPMLAPQIFSYGSRVQFGAWSAAANVRLDQMMLSTQAVSAPLGLYVVAVSYAGLVVTLPSTAAVVMLPRLIHDCAIGRGAETLTTWYRRFLWATFVAGFCLWLLASLLLPLLFGRAFVGSISLVSILIPASCILGMNQLLATGFRSHGLPGIASRAELLGLLVTVPLLLALLPRLGPYGAAIASLSAYSVSAAYLLINTRQIAGDLRAFWVPTDADWHLIRRMTRSSVGL